MISTFLSVSLLLGVSRFALVSSELVQFSVYRDQEYEDHLVDFTWNPKMNPDLSAHLGSNEIFSQFSSMNTSDFEYFRSVVIRRAQAGRLVPISTVHFYCQSTTPAVSVQVFEGDEFANLMESLDGALAELSFLTAEDRSYARWSMELVIRAKYSPPHNLLLHFPSCLRVATAVEENGSHVLSPATITSFQNEQIFLRESIASGLTREDGQNLHMDKTSEHLYERMYGQHIVPLANVEGLRVLEIGIGCDMGPNYVKGVSQIILRKLLPHAKLFVAEYKEACAEKWARATGDALDVTVLIGDQSDEATLHRWIQEAGGPFDVIIDDGGHTNRQQLVSLQVLFEHGLKPRGIYLLEDIEVSYAPSYSDYDEYHTSAVLASVSETFGLRNGVLGGRQLRDLLEGRSYAKKFAVPSLLSITWYPEAAVLIKCAEGVDRQCGGSWGSSWDWKRHEHAYELAVQAQAPAQAQA